MKTTLLLAVALVAGCSIPDPSATVTAICPTRASFTPVSPFLEDGCGTIDCHGAPARPLRIMGYEGLRLSPTDHPGGNPTTVAEVDTNYRSTCGLEPELITAVTEGQAGPDTLLLIQKPRMETHHKGGVVIVAGDDGDTCLTTWLTGQVDSAACARAAAKQMH